LKSLMIKTLVVALVAAVSMPLMSSAVSAQEGQSEGGIVAVLDVAKVFKANASFEQRMQNIKSEADSLKAQIQSEQESLRARAQQVSQYEVGTTDRNQMEAKIEQDQAALRTRARQAETDLLNREAQIYYATYIEMQKIVEQLAQKHGISLVLRFDSAEIDRFNRGEVIKGVNRAVVYHHRLDLTKLVIKTLNPQSANADVNGAQNK